MNPGPDLAARVAAVNERVDAEVETWNPRAERAHPRGIAGELVERRLRPGRGFEGADAETVLLQTVEGKLWLVWLFGAVLQQEFAGLGPGDVVAVKYEGHVDGGRGPKGYEHYRVSADQAAHGEGTEPASTAAPVESLPPNEQAVTCEACGFHDPHHAVGCPNEIPF